MNRTLVAALAMACVVGACTVGQPSTGPLPPVGPLTIYAASSLQPALEEAEALWEQGHTGSTLTFSFDSSAALETKIEQGAPADVFLSADTTNPKATTAAITSASHIQPATEAEGAWPAGAGWRVASSSIAPLSRPGMRAACPRCKDSLKPIRRLGRYTVRPIPTGGTRLP